MTELEMLKERIELFLMSMDECCEDYESCHKMTCAKCWLNHYSKIVRNNTEYNKEEE